MFANIEFQALKSVQHEKKGKNLTQQNGINGLQK